MNDMNDMNDMMTIDCRGMRCPAPILKLAKAARSAGKSPLALEILADDGDFPNDLDAWCRTAKATVHELLDEGEFTRAVIGLNGAPNPASASAAPTPPTPAPPIATPAVAPTAVPVMAAPAAGSVELDLRTLQAPLPILRLSEALALYPGQSITVRADDPTFLGDLMGWATATRVTVKSSQSDASGTMVQLQLPGQIVVSPAPTIAPALVPTTPAPSAAIAPLATTLPATQDDDIPARENQATLLVIHNDFESLMAALMVASTSAAQGMDVCVYFSFWGVNLLRADTPRKNEKSSGISILQKMMKWMMPKGPERQKMSQMHMGGVGKGMMQYFMRKNNVMSLQQLMDSCVEQNVRFVVCSMSMGIMGIEKRDIMELSNVEFAGVTCFTEMARKSAMSLTF